MTHVERNHDPVLEQRLRDVTARIQSARGNLGELERERRVLMRWAARAGWPISQIADWAGISPARVYQILSAQRAGDERADK